MLKRFYIVLIIMLCAKLNVLARVKSPTKDKKMSQFVVMTKHSDKDYVENYLKAKTAKLSKKHRKAKVKKLFEENESVAVSAKSARSSNNQISSKFAKRKFKKKSLKHKYGLDRIYLIDFSALETNEDIYASLKNDQEIEKISVVKTLSANSVPDDTLYNLPAAELETYPFNDEDILWGLRQIKAEAAWQINQGEGAVVAIIDSGISYNHPDLIENIWVNPAVVDDLNFDGRVDYQDLDVNANGKIEDNEVLENSLGINALANVGSKKYYRPLDDHGHGTHIAGTLAASADNALGIVGVAPKARLMAVKALNNKGVGSDTDLSEAIVYATDNGADIINASWGGLGDSFVLESAFEYAYSQGVLSVVAAGNENDNAGLYLPGNIKSNLVVAAVNVNQEKASYSNFGSAVDIAAPGGDKNNIVSTMDDSHNIAKGDPDLKVLDGVDGHSYYRLSGTSMATPHVAGAAAILKSLRPNFTPQQLEIAIKNETDQLANSSIGSGLLNLEKVSQVDYVPANIEFEVLSDKNSFLGRLNENVRLQGTVSAENLTSFKVEIRKNLTGLPWVEIYQGFSSIENDLILDNIDIKSFYETYDPQLAGEYKVKITTFDVDGNFYSTEESFIYQAERLLVNNCEELIAAINYPLSDEFYGLDFDLGQHINCAGTSYVPASTYAKPSYKMLIDGKGFIVLNLQIDQSARDDVGLLGAARNCIIFDLGLQNISVKGANFTGAFMGYAFDDSIIVSSFSTGDITGEEDVGGLIGSMQNSIIQNSYSEANVNATKFGAGIVGYMYDGNTVVDRSYSLGLVTGTTSMGAFVAGRDNLTRVSNCYYDLERSGEQQSAGATGLTTAEMQDKASFNQWSFETYWSITNAYPFLKNIDYIPANAGSAPSDILLSSTRVLIGASKGTLISRLNAIDPDFDDQHTFKILTQKNKNGEAIGLFTIVNDELRLAQTASGYVVGEQVELNIRATDSTSLSHIKKFQLVFTDNISNTAPSDLILDYKTELASDLSTDTLIAEVKIIDADIDDTFTLELLTTNSPFKLVGTELFTIAKLTQASYKLRFRVLDSSANTFTKELILEIQANPELKLKDFTVPENAGINYLVANLELINAPAEASISYKLIDNQDNFDIINNRIFTKRSLNYEAAQSHQLNIEVQGLNQQLTQTVNVNVTDVADEKLIRTCNELLQLNNPNYLDFALTNDIDCNGASLNAMPVFRGNLLGWNHKISNLNIEGKGFFNALDGANVQDLIFENLTITNSKQAALFGKRIRQSTISNIELDSINMQAKNTAGLATTIRGSFIERISIENSVFNAKRKVAGLAINFRNSAFENSYFNDLTLNSDNRHSAALTFKNKKASFNNSYLRVKLEAKRRRTNLSFNNAKSSLSSVYYDQDFAGFIDNKLAAKTATELMDASTYAGWDFEKIWKLEVNSFPTLR
jgi:subtilisin family serine protease